MRICTVSNRDEVFDSNLGKSKILKFHDFARASEVGNGIPSALNKLWAKGFFLDAIRMIVHDDVFIPDDFESQFVRALYQLPDKWAVLGVAGAFVSEGERHYVGHIDDRGRKFGNEFKFPIAAQTVDELLIILNDAHGQWQFDEQFPFDFYGADICMQAHERGLGVYVVPAFVHHNSSRPVGGRTPSFYDSEAKFREKWKHRLPIATTCSILR